MPATPHRAVSRLSARHTGLALLQTHNHCQRIRRQRPTYLFNKCICPRLTRSLSDKNQARGLERCSHFPMSTTDFPAAENIWKSPSSCWELGAPQFHQQELFCLQLAAKWDMIGDCCKKPHIFWVTVRQDRVSRDTKDQKEVCGKAGRCLSPSGL